MKPDARQLIARCVEDGIRRGIIRAHKHTDSPSREQLEEAIEQAVMLEVDQWFIFDERGQACS